MQAVAVMTAEHHGGGFNIQLHLSMPLRCAEPPYEVIVLSGDVSSTGVRIEHPWTHEPSFATWWPPGSEGDGLEAVVQHGLAWLDHFSDLAVLTDLLEGEFQYFDDEARKHKNGRILTNLRRWFGIGKKHPSRGHLQHLLWLAMIYEERGFLDLAWDRLEAYAAATAQHTSRSEQTRLNRHREALRKRSR